MSTQVYDVHEVHEVDSRTTGDLVRNVVGDIQEIMRSEIRLAKVEMKEEAVKAGKTGGVFGGAAIFAFFALAFVLGTCAAALAIAIPVWAALLTMCFLCFVIGGALYSFGRTLVKRIHPVPEQTISTLKEDVQWVRRRTTSENISR